MFDIERLRNEINAEFICNNLGIPMYKGGKTIYIPCPEHNERKHDNCCLKDNGYYCYSCGAHGDVIKLVQTTQNVGFIEAINIICDITGIDIRKSGKRKTSSFPLISREDAEFLRIKTKPVYHVDSIDDVPKDGCFCIDEGNESYLYINMKVAIPNPLKTLHDENLPAYKQLIRLKSKDAIRRYRKIAKYLESYPEKNESLKNLIMYARLNESRAKKIFIAHGGEYTVKTFDDSFISAAAETESLF